MCPGSFVFFGQNLFQPEGLALGGRPVHGCGIVKDDELLPTTVTTKGAHFLAAGCPHSGLTLLDGHGIHPPTFYRVRAVSGPASYVSSVSAPEICLVGERLAICRESLVRSRRFAGPPEGRCLRGPGTTNCLASYPVCPVGCRSAGLQFVFTFQGVYEVLDHRVVQVGMRG